MDPLLFGACAGGRGGRAPGGAYGPQPLQPLPEQTGIRAQVGSFASAVIAALGVGTPMHSPQGLAPVPEMQPEAVLPASQVTFYGSTTRAAASETGYGAPLMQPATLKQPQDLFGAAALLNLQHDKSSKLAARADRDQRLKQALNTMWPQVFTLICLSVYSSPISAAFHMATDPSVHFWVGNWGYFPLTIPVLLAVCHGLFLRSRRPRMIPIILSTFIPALILMITANEHLAHTGDIAHVLVSKDCTTYEDKHDMQRSWALAATLYERCVNRTISQLGLSFESGVDILRLSHCSEYVENDLDPYEDHRRNWRYLARLEDEYHCSGWCWRTRPLWTFKEVKDPCAGTVGFVLLDTVIPTCSRILAYSLLCGLLSIIGVIAAGAHFRTRGIEWALI